MKSRRVILTIEVESDASLAELKAEIRTYAFARGGPAFDTTTVKQVQANVIKSAT